MSSLRFGRVQMKIMKVIWEKGRVTAREITDELNKIRPIAHSTVQTLLRKLEVKGAVDHEIDNRTFIFYSLVKAEKVTQSALQEFVERIFSGSPSGLVSYLIKNENISKGDLKKIRELISEKEK